MPARGSRSAPLGQPLRISFPGNARIPRMLRIRALVLQHAASEGKAPYL